MDVAKMLGRCGWWRRCRCCNDRKPKGSIRAKEKRNWKREAGRDRSAG